jgi:hypothetical protein
MRLKILCVLLLVACGETSKPKDRLYVKASDTDINRKDTLPGDTCFKPTDENESPPFKYKCPCDLQEFGYHKTSNGIRHVYIRGKGFNPHLPSCKFAFYESVMNMYAGDSSFDVLKVHLLDVKNFSVITDDSEYGNNRVDGKVILVYERHKSYDTTIIDPQHTGVYHK